MYEENCSIDSVLHRMQSSLACRICLDLLNNPLTTKCGHTFCKGCLDRLHISGKASYPCPLCLTPITRRSLNQNAKISNLVSAVRNVISSIKLDCGVQEVNKNVESTSEIIYEEQQLEEAPVRRTTRKNKPILFYMDESYANSKKKIIKKVQEEDTGEKANNGCVENKTVNTSSKESPHKVNGHIKDFLIPAPNKPALNKVEQWLSKNQSVKSAQENSDNFDENLQPTQIFCPNNVASTSDVASKENPVSTNTNEGNYICSSQCSTVIFNYNDEFLTSNVDVPVKSGASKEFEEENLKEETNSMVSEKENEKDFSKAKQTEKRRGSKRILFEPNKLDNAKKTNAKKANKTLPEIDLHNKDIETEFINETLMPINKTSVKNEEYLKNTENGASEVNHISGKATVQAEHKQPNSKGHNIRFVSNLKMPTVTQIKPSKLSRGKNTKSPGWSRIEGARRDLRSKQMSLNITGGEQKLLPSDTLKLESSKGNIDSSQESVIIIDDQTQTEKTIRHPVFKKTKGLSNLHRNNFFKSNTSDNSCDKNAKVSLYSEPKTTPKLKELKLKLTRFHEEKKTEKCESKEMHDIICSEKEKTDLNLVANSVHSFKQCDGNITQSVDENKTLNSTAVEEALNKSKTSLKINSENILNVDKESSLNFDKENSLNVDKESSLNIDKENSLNVDKEKSLNVDKENVQYIGNSFTKHENKEPLKTSLNKDKLSHVKTVEVNKNVGMLNNSLTPNKEPPKTNSNEGNLSQVKTTEDTKNDENLGKILPKTCERNIDVSNKTEDDNRKNSKVIEALEEYSRKSPDIKIDKFKTMVKEQNSNEIQISDELQKASVSFVQKGSFNTKWSIPNSSCHHSIPCDLFHVLAKYSKYLINESQISNCYTEMYQKTEAVNQREGVVTSLSESTVIPESCSDNFEQNVAVIFPDKITGIRFKYIENDDCKPKDSKEPPNTTSEEYKLDSKAESDAGNHNSECVKQSQIFDLSTKINEDKHNDDQISVGERSKCCVKEVFSRECKEISEEMINSFRKVETRSHNKSSLIKYDESQIEKDLFSENEEMNESLSLLASKKALKSPSADRCDENEEMNESLFLLASKKALKSSSADRCDENEEMNESLFPLASKKALKSSSADSPIAFKRNKRIKRIESPSSSSDDEFDELVQPQKKRARKFSYTSSTSAKSKLENSPKIDSEEMRDFERYDENVWHYFKDNKDEDENCSNKENENTVTIENKKQATTYINHIDDTSDDDVIPGTEEVLKNIEADIPSRLKEGEKDFLISEKPSFKKITPLDDLFSQDSAATTTTICELNSSVKELFNKCNASLYNAHKILNNSQLSQDIEKSGPVTHKDVKKNLENNEEKEEKCENESNFSVWSTESPVLCTQEKRNMEIEVETLRNKIKVLEQEMEQKRAQLNNGNKNSSKTNIEVCTNTINETDQINVLKTIDEPGRDSDEDSEELFTTYPVESGKKHIALRSGRSQTGISRSLFKKRKPITIICTGLNQVEISSIHTFSSSLCGSDSRVVSAWSEDVTHVIVKTDEEGMAQRTYKYLLGVVSGSWVVSNSWVNDSLESKMLLPEDEYEALDCTGAPGPNRGRKNKTKLFSQFQFNLIPPFQDVSEFQLIELIQMCGGTVVKSFCEESRGPKLFVVDAENETFDKNQINRSEPLRVLVGHDWVIECIGNFAYVSLSNYLVGNPTTDEIIASEIPETLIFETQEII